MMIHSSAPTSRRIPRAALWLAGVAFALAGLGALAAQADANAGANEMAEKQAPVGRTLAGDLADRLERDYVDPEVGKAYAARLRERSGAGAYDALVDAALADAVTADLQAVNPDRHLKVRRNRPPAGAAGASASQPRPEWPEAIGKGEWLAPGIAYLRINQFPGTPQSVAAMRAFTESFRSADTIIFDARSHNGGGLDEMDVLFPVLFDTPQRLLIMDMRRSVDERVGGFLEEGPTLRRIQGPETVVRREHMVLPYSDPAMRSSARVFLLTSPRSASAAEHFAFSLKRTGRATLIGETTAGAGNFGAGVSLGPDYRVFIPSGRTLDPDTGKGWEGVGIAPHIAVPWREALVRALTEAGVDEATAKALDAARPIDPHLIEG